MVGYFEIKINRKIGGTLKFLMILTILVSTLSAHADQKMVFLVEGPDGRHVGSSSDFKNTKLETSGKKWHLYPAISTDGQTIAFVEGTGARDLRLVIKSSDKKEVFGDQGFQLQPRFAKNNNVVFFSKYIDGQNKIVKYDLGSIRKSVSPTLIEGYKHYNVKPQVLTSSAGFFPAPFMDGEKVIYQRNTDQLREIVILNLLDNTEEVIDEGMAPSLSKDERFVAYTKKHQDNWDIFVYDLLKKTVRKVTSNADRDFSPSFDVDNTLIYTSDRLENGIFSIYSQSFASWSNMKEEENLLISKKGTSFYAPRISGESKISLKDMSSMPGTTRSSFGAIEHKGKIYVVGGHQGAEHTYPPESFTARVTYYDIEKGRWFNTAPRLHKAHGFQLAAHGDYIYAFGGFAYEESTNPKWKSLSVVERFNIHTQTWEIVGHMPRNRSSNVVVTVNEKAYLIGGWDATPKFDNDYDGTFHAEIDVFDFNTQSFTTLKEKLPLKRRAFSAFEKDGMIYLAGGISEGASHFSLLDNFTRFDPVTKTFKEMTPLPFATFAPAAGTLNNKAFIFGGMFKLGGWNYEYVSHIYEYDFDTQKWKHTGRYLKEEKGFSQVVKYNNSLGVLGGHSYQNNSDMPVESFELFKFK